MTFFFFFHFFLGLGWSGSFVADRGAVGRSRPTKQISSVAMTRSKARLVDHQLRWFSMGFGRCAEAWNLFDGFLVLSQVGKLVEFFTMDYHGFL